MLTQDARDEFYGLIRDDAVFAAQYDNSETGFYQWLQDNGIGLDD